LPIITPEVSKKTKRNRKPTACADKRRSASNCGICGSANVVYQGVRYCLTCGCEEEFLLGPDEYFFSFGSKDRPAVLCECKDVYDEEAKRWTKGRQGVHHCVDCGATDGPRCPACKRRTWSLDTGRYCRTCGYRR